MADRINRPDWAEKWMEQTFDYGHDFAVAAQVGPFRQAARILGKEEVEAPVYGEPVTEEHEVYCWECETYHTETETFRPVIKDGVYRDRTFDEEEKAGIVKSLEDWFKNRARECREFLAKAEERGW